MASTTSAAQKYAASGGNFTPTTHSTTYDYISPLQLDLTGKNVVVTGAAYENGIGYATATAFARAGAPVVYVTGEEAAAQVRMRAQRLGLADAAVRLAAETSLRDILATLEAERAERLAEVNARIAEKRAAAAADVEAAKLAARSHVESAVAEVASFAGQLATGKTPAPEAVSAAVAEAMGVSA